jgi:tetratricopeptide (TPR) repeat protein
MDSIPPSERPWERIAEIASAIADPALAREAQAGYERDLASMARDPVGRRAAYGAGVALAERKWDDAIRLLQEADARRSIYDRYAWAQIARAHDLAGRADSALVYYERFLGSADAQDYADARWAARSHRWAGELYAQRGDNRRAIEHLDKFLEMWSKAEPELQGEVREARARVEEVRKRAG